MRFRRPFSTFSKEAKRRIFNQTKVYCFFVQPESERYVFLKVAACDGHRANGGFRQPISSGMHCQEPGKARDKRPRTAITHWTLVLHEDPENERPQPPIDQGAYVMFARMSSLHIALASLVAASTSLFASDAASAKRELSLNYANLETNVSTIHTFAEAPKNFDAVNADDEDLARFGLPARPDPQEEPEHYAMWTRAMQAAKIRWHGQLKPNPAEKGPLDTPLSTERMEPLAVAAPLPSRSTSYNWSGVVLTKNLSAYSRTQSFGDIYSLMTVQVGQLPFGTGCNPNVDAPEFDQYTWVGLNGYIKGAGIQPGPTRGALVGGVRSLVQCNPYVPFFTAYYAIVGWTGSELVAFDVHPGDIVYAEVGAPAGGTQPSYLFIEDLTTLTYTAYTIGVPSRYTYIGDTAEWIVSRPCCRASGYPNPLLNTGETFFDGGAALDNAGNTLYPGSQATSTQLLTMRDDYNDQNIELVYQGASGYEGNHGVMLQTTGCAWSGPCPVK